MRIGILTDIHANREAFAAVLAALDARQIDQLVFLGDLVGYGPDLDWCLDKVEELVSAGAICVRGNHDRFWQAEGLSEPARKLVDWTVNRLNARQKLFLSELPLTHRLGDVLFVHASAHQPEAWAYVTDAARAAQGFAATDARLIICGHAPGPALFGPDGARTVKPGDDIALGGGRWTAVVQAAGITRTGVAGFAILDRRTDHIEFLQTRYDPTLTLKKARVAMMPLAFVRRMLRQS